MELFFSKEFWKGTGSVQSDQDCQQMHNIYLFFFFRNTLQWNYFSLLLIRHGIDNPHNTALGHSQTDALLWWALSFWSCLHHLLFCLVPQPSWQPWYLIIWMCSETLSGCCLCPELYFPDPVPINALTFLERPTLTLLHKI